MLWIGLKIKEIPTFSGLIWAEIRALWTGGVMDYISDLWNIVDFITNMFYIAWISLRIASWYIVQVELPFWILNVKSGHWPCKSRPMCRSEGTFDILFCYVFFPALHHTYRRSYLYYTDYSSSIFS